MNFDAIADQIPYILQGLGFTLQCSLSSVVLGTLLGVPLTILRIWNIAILSKLGHFYISIMQGTPVLVQLYIIHNALPLVIPSYLPTPFESVVITFSLNSSAYISEILRGGINAIDKGQEWAARSLGMNKMQIMRYIIIPQALRKVLPSLFNEIIDMLKETSVVSVIGGADMLFRAKNVGAAKYMYLEPLIIVALVYYFMIVGIRIFATAMEKRFS